jgi:hypothetical protein
VSKNRGFATGPFTVVGLVGTALWLIAMAIYYFSNIEAVHSMKPNEFGDFLAGWLTPPALIWLVIGYFQQGIELRQNTAALSLQVGELKESVRHQGDLVRVAKQDLDVAMDARAQQLAEMRLARQPLFTVLHVNHRPKPPNKYVSEMVIANTRATAYAVSISTTESTDDLTVDLPDHAEWQSRTNKTLLYKSHGVPFTKGEVRFEYTDEAGDKGVFLLDVATNVGRLQTSVDRLVDALAK